MKTSIRTEQGGVPKGGNTNDVLTKNSNADFDDSFLPNSGGSGSGIFPQDIAVVNGSTPQTAFACTSDTDKSVYVLFGVLGSTGLVARYNQDATGKYYLVDTNVTSSYSPYNNASSAIGIAVLGGFVYTSFVDTATGNYVLLRYDKTNLNGSQTLMTISGTAPTTANGYHSMYSDGTFLYIASTGTTWYKYSISGTTATNSATITQISTVLASYCPDGTNVYLTTDGITYTRTTVTGGGSVSINRSQIFPNEVGLTAFGFVEIDSTKMYTVRLYRVDSNNAVIGSNMTFQPITKPV